MIFRNTSKLWERQWLQTVSTITSTVYSVCTTVSQLWLQWERAKYTFQSWKKWIRVRSYLAWHNWSGKKKTLYMLSGLWISGCFFFLLKIAVKSHSYRLFHQVSHSKFTGNEAPQHHRLRFPFRAKTLLTGPASFLYLEARLEEVVLGLNCILSNPNCFKSLIKSN